MTLPTGAPWSRKPILVAAFGGNAISRASDEPSAQAQFERTRAAVDHLMPVLASGRWRVVITHGNGPQVGNILLRSQLAAEQGVLPPEPIDVAVADTQGAMGYMLQQCLGNAMWESGLHQPVATVVSQVIVDEADPAFSCPDKPVGRFYDDATARELAGTGLAMSPDPGGRGWRRVVASPQPKEVIEAPVIARLLDQGVIVVACGGGGIPVVPGPTGSLTGIEAVIDKDLASSLLATALHADALAILTEVEQVSLFYGGPRQEGLGDVEVGALRRYASEGHFPPGSMGPKVEAAARFIEAGGSRALITDPEHFEQALRGGAGTQVLPSLDRPAAAEV